MNLLLIIVGAVLILAAGFILKGRKNQADRNARYRAPRPILKLDRASAGLGRSKERSPLLSKMRPTASPAAPITLGVVLMVLSLWLAAAYLRPSAESAEGKAPANQTTMPAPQPAQVGALAGRLSAATPATPAANQPPATVTAATPTAPLAGVAHAALSQAAVTLAKDSALSQVGLMPTRRQPSPPPPTPRPSPEPTNRPSEARPAATRPEQNPAPAPTAKAPTASAAANSNLVRAAAEPPAGVPAAAAGSVRTGILSNMEGFTVHLGSFVDQANAEKFRAKLIAAGNPATISEIDMDGRRWYRVLSGRFETRAAADAHGRELRRRGLIDDTGPFIVKPIKSDN